MSTNKKILIGVLFLSLILAAVMFLGDAKSAIATTNRKIYAQSESLEIIIKNSSGDTICFSSCYPYFVEKMDGVWTPYSYGICKKENMTVSCVPNMGEKKFRLVLDYEMKGLHRLRIPICRGCAEGQKFEQNSELFSNEFEIN